MADAEYGLLAGEPDVIDSHATHFSEMADKIDAAVRALRKLQSLDHMRGQAIRKLSSTAGKVADDIIRAKGRYTATGAALAGYSPRLRQAKTDAQRASAQLDELNGQLGTARRSQTDAADAVLTAGDDPTATQQAQRQKAAADAHLAGLSSDVATWQKLWHDAAQSKNDAGDAAADQVHDADSSDSLTDGWKDKIAAAWHSVTTHVTAFLKSDLFDHLLSALDIATQVLGVIALVIAFIPGIDLADLGIGPVLAGLTALDTAGHLAQDAARGDGKKAVFDGVVGAISIFGGGAVKVLAKNAARVAEPVASAATKAAESGALRSGLSDVMADAGRFGVASRVGTVAAKIGARATKLKSGVKPFVNTAGKIAEDGVDELKGGPYSWVIEGFKDPYAILGTTKETMKVLNSGALGTGKMVSLSLAQGVVSAVRLNEERAQVAKVLGLPEDPFARGGEE
ncbi:MAG TPA: hypothetical protein VGC45_11935 [Gryllotalpicola sp.]